MTILRVSFLCLAALLAGAATPAPVAGTVESMDGRKFVKLEQWQGEPVLLMFWDVDCAPCYGELHSLPSITKSLPGWQVHTLALSQRRRSRDVLKELPASRAEHFMSPIEGGKAMLARFGNRYGDLPFTAALNADGTYCATYLGLLEPKAIEAFRKRCR